MEYATYMHELKNPLRVIYGAAQLLKVDSSDLNAQLINMIINSVKNLKAIEEDFNTYCKTKKHTIKYEIVDVRQLLSDAIAEYAPMASKYDVKILRGRFRKARAFTSTSKLKQVIVNVLSNAIKYNKPGGTVTVECYTKGSNMYMGVSDTGIGMSKKELELIGRPFYRSKTIDRPGTGLGMCTTINLSNMLNFDMKIKSVIGLGTDIRFVLRHIIG